MTTYAVLVPGDEDTWEQASPDHRAEVYRRHEEFVARLAERGHRVTGGAELSHSRTARTVRLDPDGSMIVTEGPYAEAAEQLTGFYLVASDDLDDLLTVVALLAGVESGIEVRATAGGDGS